MRRGGCKIPRLHDVGGNFYTYFLLRKCFEYGIPSTMPLNDVRMSCIEDARITSPEIVFIMLPLESGMGRSCQPCASFVI